MEKQVVVSAIGADRPGFVHRISEVIVQHRGNITLQRSVKLGGDFAIILMFHVDVADDAELQRIIEELNGLQGDQIQIVAKPASSETQPGGTACEIQVSGVDQPGIINTLTLFLLERGINIQSMDYTVASGPFTAAPMFNATVRFSMPAGSDVETLQKGLAEVEQDFDVDIRLTLPAKEA